MECGRVRTPDSFVSRSNQGVTSWPLQFEQIHSAKDSLPEGTHLHPTLAEVGRQRRSTNGPPGQDRCRALLCLWPLTTFVPKIAGLSAGNQNPTLVDG